MTTAVHVGRTGSGRRIAWRWLRPFAAVATFAILVWRVGTGPFLDGLHAVDRGALAAAVALGVATTLCCAWRWRIVARGLGVDLPLGTALAAYYRSIFLNVTLPGGVVGDVHRGISHGRDTSDVGRGLRAVAWERSAGQAVQVVLTVLVLLALPSPVRAAVPYVAVGLLVAVAGVALLARARPAAARSRWARLRGAAARDLREALLARRAWPAIALTSAVIVAGHAATFLIAARTTGVAAPVSRVLPLALVVMMAGVLPNVGGWGPREGVTAWAFAGAGLGASVGVATAVVYGVMAFVATLPGAAVLVVDWVRRSRSARRPARPQPTDPQRTDRKLSDPQAGDPQLNDPQPGDPQLGHPQPGDPQLGHPQPGDPQLGHPQPGDPQPGDPRPGHPRTGHPRPTLPRPTHPRPSRPRSRTLGILVSREEGSDA